MIEWINECDLKPNPGDVFERIGLLGPNSITIYRHKKEGIGSQIIEFEFYTKLSCYSDLSLREFSGVGPMNFSIIKRDYEGRLYWMVAPCQYRKIIDRKEISKYKSMPKFDWRYL